MKVALYVEEKVEIFLPAQEKKMQKNHSVYAKQNVQRKN